MAIQITVTIEEVPDGSVTTRIQARDVGTLHEAVFAKAVLEGIRGSLKKVSDKDEVLWKTEILKSFRSGNPS